MSSHQEPHQKELMQDGLIKTFWHSRFKPAAPAPHFVVFEHPGTTAVTGLSYHRHRGANGHIKKYTVYLSDDGQNWDAPLMSGQLTVTHTSEQEITFPEPTTKKFIKFEVVEAVSIKKGQNIAAIGELDVLVK